jgi:hypothetical protein
VSTCHFRVVPAQARSKMWAGPCSPPCRDSRHGTALVFVSCQHGPKYFVSCRTSGRAKKPCHDPPSNDTVQVPALLQSSLTSDKEWHQVKRTAGESRRMSLCPRQVALLLRIFVEKDKWWGCCPVCDLTADAIQDSACLPGLVVRTCLVAVVKRE